MSYLATIIGLNTISAVRLIRSIDVAFGWIHGLYPQVTHTFSLRPFRYSTTKIVQSHFGQVLVIIICVAPSLAALESYALMKRRAKVRV